MKKNTMVKNELPELLEAIYAHDDTPEWLTMAIWDAFNNRHIEIDDANYWRWMLEATSEPEQTPGMSVIKGGKR
jgi:hypothetical protein